jgi:CRISPR-associated exonuclease Cas4
MEYQEEDYLLLSGIQHFVFCRRQWALIHIEQQWEENVRTFEGRVMHENAHNADFHEKRNGVIMVRAMKVFSREMGISGECDVVEFQPAPEGITLAGQKGTYIAVPVEYKRGKPKPHNADEMQLMAQAMCLEEMLMTRIPKGYLYYGETRRRTEVLFTEELRQSVRSCFEEMHAYYSRKYTPMVKKGTYCRQCSLNNICLPELSGAQPADAYVSEMLKEELQ